MLMWYNRRLPFINKGQAHFTSTSESENFENFALSDPRKRKSLPNHIFAARRELDSSRCLYRDLLVEISSFRVFNREPQGCSGTQTSHADRRFGSQMRNSCPTTIKALLSHTGQSLPASWPGLGSREGLPEPPNRAGWPLDALEHSYQPYESCGKSYATPERLGSANGDERWTYFLFANKK